MPLTDDELAMVRAVVDAELDGRDSNDAALNAVPNLNDRQKAVTLDRLNDAGYLDVAIQRAGNADFTMAHVRRATALGVEAVRAADDEGTDGGAAVLTVVELQEIERLLTMARRLEADGAFDSLEPDALADTLAQLATVEAQAKSPRPKRRIVSDALKSLAGNVAGNATFAGIVELVRQFTG